MRKIEIQNDRIFKSLSKKQEIIDELNKLEEEADKLRKRGGEIEEEVNKYLNKIKREDELVRPEVLRELEAVEFEEFEDLSSCYLEQEGEDKGKVFLKIADRLEEFKTYFKEQKEKEKNGQNNGSDTNNNNSGDNPEAPAESEDDSSGGQGEEGGELGEE